MEETTVLVTGASRGIGRAVAERFAEAGATVVACARDEGALDDAVAAMTDDGGDVHAVRADVRDEFDCERLAEVAAKTGPPGIDVVVANAGVYHGDPGETPIHEESYSAFDDHCRTNGRGVFATLREVVPHATEDARGIVTTGSVARDAMPGLGSYAVSKATAEAVARAFAVDTDLVVGCVDPGQVATELSGPTGRDPADVADMFLWAAREAPPEDFDGAVLTLGDWKRATR